MAEPLSKRRKRAVARIARSISFAPKDLESRMPLTRHRAAYIERIASRALAAVIEAKTEPAPRRNLDE